MGLGGDTAIAGNLNLAQTGTVYNINENGILNHQGFYEIIDSNGNQYPQPAGFMANAGDSVYAETKHNTDGSLQFTLIDNNTGGYWSLSVNNRSWSGGSAEWITERPVGASQLADMYYVNFWQVVVNSKFLNQTSYQAEAIANVDSSTGHTLDLPNPSTGGDVSSFTNWWKNCN